MGFLLAKAVIDGRERLSVLAETALPHMPAWTAVDPGDVRANPWDFEEPDEDAAPDLGPAVTGASPVDATPAPALDASELPTRNASAAEWRTYAGKKLLPDPDLYSRDELRDHYLTDLPLPSKENHNG